MPAWLRSVLHTSTRMPRFVFWLGGGHDSGLFPRLGAFGGPRSVKAHESVQNWPASAQCDRLCLRVAGRPQRRLAAALGAAPAPPDVTTAREQEWQGSKNGKGAGSDSEGGGMEEKTASRRRTGPEGESGGRAVVAAASCREAHWAAVVAAAFGWEAHWAAVVAVAFGWEAHWAAVVAVAFGWEARCQMVWRSA
eukprot:360288-Chlamydomonas_euryale.AAC.1